MRWRVLVLLLVTVVLSGAAGCRRSARVIPPKKLARIYAEMFLTDQWLRDYPDARKTADTTLVFDPIFRRHGVTFADYDRSVHYYLDRPEQYGKILAMAADRLQAGSDQKQAVIDARRAREAELDRFRRLYHPKDFTTDSLRWSGPETLWPAYVPAEAPADSLAADSLGTRKALVPADTWEVVKPQEPAERPRPRRIPVNELKELPARGLDKELELK